ncbi:MAG: Txe/YoeB family addiction module toxin [Saprospiraceae bacterium]
MILAWNSRAWEDYLFWQKHDRKIVNRINTLLQEITRSPLDGTGKPEHLKNNLAGYHARRITDEHRLIYKVFNVRILIIQCRFYY